MKQEGSALVVERTALKESVSRLRKVGKSSSEPVSLEFSNGSLIISWTGASEQIPAVGEWLTGVHVPAGWLRALAKAFPVADPFRIRIVDGRVYTGSLSCPIVAAAGVSDRVSVEDRERRIAKATAALKSFRISREDIESLVDQSELEGRFRYHPDEDRLLRCVAEAWASLAVFGVDADQIYRAIQNQIRQAWTLGGRNA